MIDIPKNPTPRDFDAEVDKAVEAVLKDMQSSPHGVGALSVNHGSMRFHVMNDVAARVASLFKEKGYHAHYAHYCHAVDGTPYLLEITPYPTDHDI